MTDATSADVTPRSSPQHLKAFLYRNKYECLLGALLQHLFSAALIPDLAFYSHVVWPINMVVLGVVSVGVFADRGRKQRAYWNLLSVLVIVVAVVPALPWVIPSENNFMLGFSISYFLFFTAIFVQVLRYLLRPSYINTDIVSAAICGFLLLLETGIFLIQTLYYAVPVSLSGVDTQSLTSTHLDIVYFSSITLTSIGFGDIVPTHHVTKLATAALGITGQMYSVVLVGILMSKYASVQKEPPP